MTKAMQDGLFVAMGTVMKRSNPDAIVVKIDANGQQFAGSRDLYCLGNIDSCISLYKNKKRSQMTPLKYLISK